MSKTKSIDQDSSINPVALRSTSVTTKTSVYTSTNSFINRYSIYDNHYDEINATDVLDLYSNENKINKLMTQSSSVSTSSSLSSSSNSNSMVTSTPVHADKNDNVFDELYSVPRKISPNNYNGVEDVELNKGNFEEDCSKEWDKVHRILESLEYILDDENLLVNNNNTENGTNKTFPFDKNSINYDSISKSNQITIYELLQKVGLTKYLTNFLSNGFDDTNFLNNVIDNDDFKQIGIGEKYEIEKILKEIDNLPIMKKIDEKQYYTINEWLSDLNLTQYIEQFYRKNICTIAKLKKLYEIEFITLLNIRLLGHRKRMLYSLGFLKQKMNRQSSRQSIKSIEIYSNCKENNNNNSNNYSFVDSLNDTSDSINQKTSPTSINRLKSVTFADKIENVYEEEKNLYRNSNGSANITSFNSLNSNNNINQEAETKIKESNDNKGLNSKKSTNYSQYLKQYKSAKTIWRHDPEKLLTIGCEYNARYLGSSALNRLYSNKSPIKYAIDRLKMSAKQSPHPVPTVILNISTSGVKLMHPETNDLLWNHDIKHITSVCQDQEDLVYFALITKSDPNSYHYCHVFYCLSADISNELILTIGQAFDLAYESFCKKNFS